MPGIAHKIAFVVPTKDRPRDLHRMLGSVASQSCLPDQMIVVDGGDETVEQVAAEFPTLNVQYLRVYPPSLSKQRNAGIEVVDPSMTLAGYLDDDLVLESGSMEAMSAFWEKAPPEVGGARFNIVNEELPRSVWLKSWLLMDSPVRGTILPSGFHTSIGTVAEDKHVRWLTGGVTLWRRRVIEEFSYDEWFSGTGSLEDVDYSYRVGRKYQLVVVAGARVQHLSYPIRKDRNYLLGKWQAINRIYFVRKNPELSLPLCLWALWGQLLLNVAKSIAERNSVGLRRATGNLVGLFRLATGRTNTTGGILK